MIKLYVKKALVLLLTVVLCSAIPVRAETQNPEIRVISTVCEAGKIVGVKLWLSGNTGITSLRIGIEYDDTAMSLQSVCDGGILGNSYHSDNISSPYTLYWANDTEEENFTGDGVIAEMLFKLDDTVSEGQSFSVNPVWISDEYDALDKDLKSVNIDVFSGLVTVESTVEGLNAPFSYVVSDGMISVGGISNDTVSVVVDPVYSANGNEYTVREISDYAFAGKSTLESILLPDTITSIGQGAFLGCGALKTIDIPDGVSHIGAAAFDGTAAEIYCYPYSAAHNTIEKTDSNYIIYGDLVTDMSINATDLAKMKSLLLTDNNVYIKIADIKRDESFDILDFIRLKKVCAQTV